MRFIGLEIGHFLVAVTFLTQLPMPGVPDHSEGRLARASRYFPLAGVLVGVLAGGVFYAASFVFSPMAAAAIALAIAIILGGGLHEDGLADTFDGLGGAKNSERALEIMRDSRIGTFGACALVLSILLRWAALAVASPTGGLIALVVAHSVSRALMTPILTSTHYVRSQGLALSVAGGVRNGEAAVAMLLAIAIAMTAGPVAGLGAVAAGIVAAGLMLAWAIRRLRGYTGDVLGAVQQCAEIAILLVLCQALA